MAMKVYTLDEMEDKYIGKVGTPERDKYEQELADELHAYHVGKAIKQAREAPYGDVKTVVFSPKIHRAIEGEEVLAKKGRKGKK